jgi:formylglycine-generating enzyme required for sulfatase activity
LRWVAIGAVALGAIYAAFIIFDRFGSSSSDRRPGAEVAVAPTPARTPAPTELGPELLPDPVDTGLLKVEPERPGDPPAFEVFIHEITCSMYRDFLQGTLLGQHNPDGWSVGFNPPDGWEELPVTGIGWEDAVAYCRWFGQVKGLPPNTARLPTRAEVERMLRYPLSRRLGGSIADPGALERLGQRFDRLTVVGSERRDMLFHPEGQIYGLIGNAAEWGWERNDRGERVVFGAGFEGDGEAPDPLRPKHRPSDARHPIIGFRVVIGSRPLPPQ